MKRFALAAAATAAVAAPVVASAPATAASGKTIVAIAAGNPQFSTLVTLVKQAGLVSTLNGTTKYTVFAPTNAAFNKLPKATLKAVASNKALLKKILLYHVIPGTVPAAKVVKLSGAKTAEGKRVRFTVKGGKAYVNGVQIVKTDIRASNGIVHVINSVLMP